MINITQKRNESILICILYYFIDLLQNLNCIGIGISQLKSMFVVKILFDFELVNYKVL